jgi:glycerol-3-phosphate acyltransferase PlsX
MATTYFSLKFNQDARVRILSVGEENEKGNALVKAAIPRLTETLGPSFLGAVEGRDLFNGLADVILADGFAGNVALKTAEGTFKATAEFSKDYPLLALLAVPLGLVLKRKLDPNQYGGAPLLGTEKAVCIIGHGNSTTTGAFNAIRSARDCVRLGLCQAIAEKMAPKP